MSLLRRYRLTNEDQRRDAMSTLDQFDDGVAAGRVQEGADDRGEILSLTLWPHRSLPPRHLVGVVALVLVGFSLPMAGLVGGGAFWVVAAFDAATLGLLVGLICLTYRSGRVTERLDLWPDRLRIERVEPDGRRRVWEANPYWVRVSLHDTPRIANYLVLSASGRQVELGAFLSPDERVALAQALRAGLADALRAATLRP